MENIEKEDQNNETTQAVLEETSEQKPDPQELEKKENEQETNQAHTEENQEAKDEKPSSEQQDNQTELVPEKEDDKKENEDGNENEIENVQQEVQEEKAPEEPIADKSNEIVDNVSLENKKEEEVSSLTNIEGEKKETVEEKIEPQSTGEIQEEKKQEEVAISEEGNQVKSNGDQKQSQETAEAPIKTETTSKQPIKKTTKKPPTTKTKFDKYSSIDDRLKDNAPKEDFDEIPVGAGGTFQVSEYPEGMQPFPDESAATDAPQDTGPLATRVKSKVWKVRQSAFEELATKFQEATPEDPIFGEYGGDLEKFIADANPGSQEKALEVLKVFLLKKDGENLDAHSTTKTLIDKAIGPGKSNIKTLSFEIACLMFEKMDKSAMFNGIIDSINQKNQKTTIAGIQTVVELLKNYGPKRLEFLKPFFPHIEKVAGSTVATLRSETMNFYKEAYRFMGEALKTNLAKLKKAQVDELEKFFAECPKELAQPLKAEEIAASGKKGNGASGLPGAGGFDAYEIADPVDIFKKFNDKWASKTLGLDNWNQKKNALEEFLKEIELNPKLASVGIQHINAMLKKLLNDHNFPIVFATVKIYGALAKGLRKNYHTQCKLIMPFLLEKLKDKRSALIEETNKTLDNFLYCITPDDVIEDLKEGLNQKSPSFRISLLSWINRYFEKQSQNKDKLLNIFKNLLPGLKKLVDDSSNEVREAAIKTLAQQKVILGDDVIGTSYDDLNPTRLSKIHTVVAEITGNPVAQTTETSKVEGSTASPSGKTARAKMGTSFKENVEEEKTSSKALTTKPEAKTTPGKSNLNATKKADAEGKKSAPSKESVSKLQESKSLPTDFELNITEEDVEFKLAELEFPEKISHSLNDANWKEKQKGLVDYLQWIIERQDSLSGCIEYVYLYLKSKMKDWKESNPNVVKELINIITQVTANQHIIHNQKAATIILSFILLNVQETKFSQQFYAIICSLMETVHPKFIIQFLISSFKQTKTAKPNPKSLVEVCNLLRKLVDELVIILFPFQETIEFGKTVLAGTLPANKTAGVGLFKALYQQVGPPLLDFLTDINPQTLKTLQTEFSKLDLRKNLICNINFRGQLANDLQKELSQSLDPLESLPRIDISKDADKILKKLNDNDWKVKQEGLDALDTILAGTGNRISGNGLQNLVNTLRQRLNDNHKNQVKNFIIFVGKLIYALGPEAKQYAKILLPEIVKTLSDKQAITRNETVKTIDKFGDAIGGEVVINSLLPLLSSESPEQRMEVLNWTLKNYECLAKADVKNEVGPVLAVLSDKTKEIRALAERLFEKCVEVIGIEPYKTVLVDMKPAVQNQLKPIFFKLTGDEEYNPKNNTSVSLEKSKVSETGKNIKVPSDPTLEELTKTAKARARVKQETYLKTEPDDVREVGKKGTLTQLETSVINMSSGSLNNSLSSINEPLVAKQLTPTGEKNKRQEEDKKTKWSTEEVRNDLVNKLKDHFKKNVSKDLFAKLFATDSKKHIEAVKVLSKSLIVEFQDTVEILDMILRWFFVRLWDNVNTQIMKESLDYFFNLITQLESANYTLLDFEANVLIPCLVNRLGTGPSNLKASLHKIFPKLGGVSSPQKIAGFLVDALRSRSHKTKIESIEVLTEMVKTYGVEILSQKDMKVYGKLLGDFDVNIKTNALKLMIEIGQVMGEELLNIIGNDVPPKLQESIQQNKQGSRNSPRDVEKEREKEKEITGHLSKIEIDQRFDEIQEVEEEQGMFMSQYKPKKPRVMIPTPRVIADDSSDKFEQMEELVKEESGEKTPLGKNPLDESMEGEEQIKSELNNVVLLGEKVEEDLFQKCIELLKKGSIAGKLDALLFIQDIISSENQENKDFLARNTGFLLEAFQEVLSLLFTTPSSQVPLKFLLYFLDVIHKLATMKSFLQEISEENLQSFLQTLFQNLLTQNDQSRYEKDSSSVVRILNSIILRLLENSDPNKSLAALYSLVSQFTTSREDDKIIGLSLKCILKLAKALRPLVSSIKPEQILLTLHKFLLTHEMSDLQPQEELQVQSVKIILQELVDMFGERLYNAYSQGVEKHSEKDHHLRSWISTLLQAKADSDWTPITYDKIEDSNELPLEIEDPDEVQHRIRGLIAKIKSSVDYKKAIEDLYNELHQNKNISIEPYLEEEKDSLRWYVSAALERIHFEKGLPGFEKTFQKEKTNLFIKPVQQKFEKENQDGLVQSDSKEAEKARADILMNTLRLRLALLSKNPNSELKETNKVVQKEAERVGIEKKDQNVVENKKTEPVIQPKIVVKPAETSESEQEQKQEEIKQVEKVSCSPIEEERKEEITPIQETIETKEEIREQEEKTTVPAETIKSEESQGNPANPEPEETTETPELQSQNENTEKEQEEVKENDGEGQFSKPEEKAVVKNEKNEQDKEEKEEGFSEPKEEVQLEATNKEQKEENEDPQGDIEKPQTEQEKINDAKEEEEEDDAEIL